MNDDSTTTISEPVPRPVGSLGRRLVLATLGFCLLFTLATVGLRTWTAWQNNLAEMNAELALIDQVFRSTLSKAIWEMDSDSLHSQLDSVVQRQRGEQPAEHRAPRLQHQLSYEPYAGASETVGELVLEGNEELLWERMLAEVYDIVITQVIQSLLLAGLIMWMFNRTVTLHVRRIARHLTRLTPDNLDRSLRLDRSPKRHDELSLLEGGVNSLQAKLSAYLERQHQDELALAAHRDRLAELVEERTAELRAANVQLEELSRSDPLTGLANRRQFDEIKEVEFRRALRQDQPLAVLMCDVDFFKRYNDHYGHAQGDQCLRMVADTLQSVFARAGEVVARLGGEEFVVLLPGVDAEAARRAAVRLQQRLAERELPHEASAVSPYVTFSIGLAVLDPDTMDQFDQLLHRADEALYRAKTHGRNCISA